MPPTIPAVSVNIQNYSGTVVYRNLVINQVVNGHHQFSFVWNVGTLSHDSNSQLDLIKNNIGSVVTVEIDDNNFQGIITQISVHEQTDTSQSFTVKGQGMTILLDDVPHSGTYYKKSLKKIVKATLDGIPDNVMQTDVDPQTSEDLHYITQYNETDFQFLQRLATRYGEWFYYDGTALKFGHTGDSDANLRSGSNLTSYSIKANLVSNRYAYRSYDYSTGESVTKELASFSSDVRNDFSGAAADKSKEVYTRTVDRPMHNFNLVNKKMIDAVAELEMKRLAAQLLFAKGESKHGALKPGYKFVVETANGNYDYIATHVTHMSNVTGHYENTFQAVPATVKVPPYTNPHTFRQAHVQTAVVKENHDTDGLNRIKVQFPWQSSADASLWIRVATPHAGGEKGWHFIPEKDEEVIIDFEGGDVDKPFMVAAHFHGKAKSKTSDADNNIKSLITKSGNTFTLNDKDGSITLTDPSGSTVILLGDETIEIKSKKKITVQSKDIEFNAENDIKLNAKNNIALSATKNIEIGANETATIKAMKAVAVKSSTDKVTVEGMQDVSVKSGAGAVKIEATTEFKAKGTVGATVEGLKLDLKGTAMASLQAALVKIN